MIILRRYQYLNATRRFDNKGYYEVSTEYFEVEADDDLNTKYFTDDVIFRLCKTVYSINKEDIFERGADFVEFYTSTVVAVNRIAKNSYDVKINGGYLNLRTNLKF